MGGIKSHPQRLVWLFMPQASNRPFIPRLPNGTAFTGLDRYFVAPLFPQTLPSPSSPVFADHFAFCFSALHFCLSTLYLRLLKTKKTEAMRVTLPHCLHHLPSSLSHMFCLCLLWAWSSFYLIYSRISLQQISLSSTSSVFLFLLHYSHQHTNMYFFFLELRNKTILLAPFLHPFLPYALVRYFPIN